MTREKLTPQQISIIESPPEEKIFLEGSAGTGKTTVGVHRLLYLLEKGVRPGEILVILPQRTLAAPYQEALRNVPSGGMVSILTIGSLAQSMVELFWPVISRKAGFTNPQKLPTFLSLETAQYYMARIVKPLLLKGYFQTLTINRNRLYSQILDNLNKASLVGFSYLEIGKRLKASWLGEQSQSNIYEESQECARLFREYCLSNNLLDFSLKIDVFAKHLWPLPVCREHLLNKYKHIIFDNLEEDTPVAHDVLDEWLPHCESALIIYDGNAGYRRFLGADPKNGITIKKYFRNQVLFTDSFVTSPGLRAFGYNLSCGLRRPVQKESGDMRDAISFEPHRYHTQMLDWVSQEIGRLVNRERVPQEEIIVLAPFLTDALRFSLINRLEQEGVSARSHRPSRALREEPATQCLLTLSSIGHPSWEITPTKFDVAYALMQSIDEMDLVRAQLLAGNLYHSPDSKPVLTSFDRLTTALQRRITYVFGEKYEKLRNWLENYADGPAAELDHFLSRLFGEVLSQEGYGFYSRIDAGETAANLIDSVKKFRKITGTTDDGKSSGREYMEMVQDGLVADQYVRSWDFSSKDSVLLAPAYTFLMSNRPVDYQFWLNVGSAGWWERLYQPLTHPYVLSRQWDPKEIWTDVHEFEVRQDALHRLLLGLICRCRKKIYLGLSELGEQGYEQQGPLLRAIQEALRNSGREVSYV